MLHGEVPNGTIKLTCLRRQSELDEEFQDIRLRGELLGGRWINFYETIEHLLETGQNGSSRGGWLLLLALRPCHRHLPSPREGWE